MDLSEAVIDIYPVIPGEPVPEDDFWEQISKEIRQRSDGDIRTLVFDLWSQRVAAESIMKIVGITHDELDATIPKSRWLAMKWVRCAKCGGSGGRHITVPWAEQRSKGESK